MNHRLVKTDFVLSILLILVVRHHFQSSSVPKMGPPFFTQKTDTFGELSGNPLSPNLRRNLYTNVKVKRSDDYSWPRSNSLCSSQFGLTPHIWDLRVIRVDLSLSNNVPPVNKVRRVLTLNRVLLPPSWKSRFWSSQDPFDVPTSTV